jgi:hypothetical protein
MDFDHFRRRLGLVPNGNTSLAEQRQRLRDAERELASARQSMRAAADAAGIARSGLFSDTHFVPRSTADGWYNDGVSEGRREVIDALLRASGQDPAKVHAKIAASLKTSRLAAEARAARWKALMTDAGFFAAVADKDFERAGRILAEMHPVLTQLDAHVVPRHVAERLGQHPGGRVKATAEGVLRAAALRDRGGPEPPPPTGLAAKIVEAGRKARRPTGSDDE